MAFFRTLKWSRNKETPEGMHGTLQIVRSHYRRVIRVMSTSPGLVGSQISGSIQRGYCITCKHVSLTLIKSSREGRLRPTRFSLLTGLLATHIWHLLIYLAHDAHRSTRQITSTSNLLPAHAHKGHVSLIEDPTFAGHGAVDVGSPTV